MLYRGWRITRDDSASCRRCHAPRIVHQLIVSHVAQSCPCRYRRRRSEFLLPMMMLLFIMVFFFCSKFMFLNSATLSLFLATH